MRRLGPFSLEGALLVVGLGVALLGGGTCTARHYAERSARIVALEVQVSEAQHRTDSLTRLVDSVTRNVTTRMASNRQISRRLSARLAANDSLLRDTIPSHDSIVMNNLRLRDALAQTSEVARLYRDSTDVLLGSVERLIAAHEDERQGNIKLLAAKDSVISALRESGQACRILFVPCPSRVQSVGIGAASMLLLILL